MPEIRKVLFPCDLTENSLKVLPYVLSVSEKCDSMIYLLHVVQDLHKWGKGYIPHGSMDVFQKQALEGAEKALDSFFEESALGEHISSFQKRIVSGDPANEILKAVESEGIDMVVMGTHGRKGLEHTIFGSVAENVVKRAPVPVMIVNPYRVE
ncbi:MAG: hypothetical protein BA872_09130 [Desulfobacterales bacterium C00003060]|nr:MAG: hypothetical protein BA861_09375 [Desulfobacterales bacterium S3730MH5]OEU78211.1 MAG: hypothetical protein BA865_06890 [Desulfobacterales bacterium S5133MH4]OEU78413.1 MAG: hypothetical protein BA872_09130 [Desulfobacterales bacterium C00003060]